MFMNSSNKCNQNGGQPLKSAKNVSETKDKVCHDFVRGKCYRSQCKLSHECDIQTMVEILRICHDYQNSTGCTRANCSYLHVSREEEKLFRESGKYPDVLVTKHKKMNEQNMPRMAGQPLQTPAAGPPPVLSVNPMYQQGPRWFLLPPPPPPKEPSQPPQPYSGPGPSATPRPPHGFDTTKPPPPLPQAFIQNGVMTRLPGPSTAMPPPSTLPPQELPPMEIDTSRPPPPIAPRLTADKRPITEAFGPGNEAGPSHKSRKISDSSSCEICMQWELRKMLSEKKKKEKLKEKGIVLLKFEEKKKEINSIKELLGGLGLSQVENMNTDSNDQASDLGLPNDIDSLILRDSELFNQIAKKLSQSKEQSVSDSGTPIVSLRPNGQTVLMANGSAPSPHSHPFPNNLAHPHPPPPHHYNQPYRPQLNNHLNHQMTIQNGSPLANQINSPLPNILHNNMVNNIPNSMPNNMLNNMPNNTPNNTPNNMAFNMPNQYNVNQMNHQANQFNHYLQPGPSHRALEPPTRPPPSNLPNPLPPTMPPHADNFYMMGRFPPPFP
ncbi:serine/threonine-protein kinase pakB isoform X1 [Amyelois transitella]|uniref:serine/threonine-protein kinase pakB isoform X1 n=1 Tax=Amyelois transitella TaxID=680683 RepID=UPI00298F4A92|nr:serine/threonine-protein kinase pakB isoform X1 [Amyelois transitella]